MSTGRGPQGAERCAGEGLQIELPTARERQWHTLRLLEAKIADAVESALADAHGLSLAEYNALAALVYSDDDGHLRQQVLAEAIPLKVSSVSRLVARLERAGLSERYLCATDRRGVYTQITEAGRALLAQARRTYLEAMDRALGRTADDPRFTPMVAFLRAADGTHEADDTRTALHELAQHPEPESRSKNTTGR